MLSYGEGPHGPILLDKALDSQPFFPFVTWTPNISHGEGPKGTMLCLLWIRPDIILHELRGPFGHDVVSPVSTGAKKRATLLYGFK